MVPGERDRAEPDATGSEDSIGSSGELSLRERQGENPGQGRDEESGGEEDQQDEPPSTIGGERDRA